MYIVKETTKHGVVIHHGPFITMKGITKFQQEKRDAGSKTVAKNLTVPVWNKEKNETKAEWVDRMGQIMGDYAKKNMKEEK